ncbi:MAG: hypothetical protein QM703_08540 [Gemmatales bacterium]
MLDKVFRFILILATLHLHAPLCRLQASCAAPVIGNTSSEPEEEEICECCRKAPATPKPAQPLEGSQKSSPCNCLCGIIAVGYVPLTPVVQVGMVQVVSFHINVGASFNKQDGFKQGIDRPPR